MTPCMRTSQCYRQPAPVTPSISPAPTPSHAGLSSVCVQDDIMHADLTVEENLMFSARHRLPAAMTHSQHLFFVERAIQVRLSLRLQHAGAACSICDRQEPECAAQHILSRTCQGAGGEAPAGAECLLVCRCCILRLALVRILCVQGVSGGQSKQAEWNSASSRLIGDLQLALTGLQQAGWCTAGAAAGGRAH